MTARASAHSRGYDSRWQRARVAYLVAHPLCRLCEQLGRVTAATVVDHVVPHRGDRALFWDSGNWQPLCKPCHDGAKARQERTGVLPGCDLDGVPADPHHPWNVSA
jgi:5-methylcytosine-specific restriction enzyme A